MVRRRHPPGSPTLGETFAVWALFALDAAALAAYQRRRGGMPGAAVARFVAHPWAPASLPLGGLALARLGRDRATPATLRAALAALLLPLFGAGMRRRPRRPARSAEPLPTAALTFAAALTLQAIPDPRRRSAAFAPATAADRPRLALGGALFLVAIPWLCAEVGIDANHLPLIGPLYLDRPHPAHPGRTAVHLGHHHGLDGALLAWAALALSRQLPQLEPGPAADLLSLDLAALLLYGLARAAEDAWAEQVVNRGRTTRRLPPLVSHGRPVGPRAWLAVAALALALHARWRPRPATPRPTAGDAQLPPLSRRPSILAASRRPPGARP